MKIRRQAMSVSIEELRALADELEEQLREEEEEFNVSLKGQVFQVNIINETLDCSDHWRFEK